MQWLVNLGGEAKIGLEKQFPNEGSVYEKLKEVAKDGVKGMDDFVAEQSPFATATKKFIEDKGKEIAGSGVGFKAWDFDILFENDESMLKFVKAWCKDFEDQRKRHWVWMNARAIGDDE